MDQRSRASSGGDPTVTHLHLDRVSKRYDGQDVLAVDEVSLQVRRGEFFGLLGPSGCGKTTTLNMIAGFVNPSAGEIHLGNERLDMLPPHRRGTAMVFQDYGLFPHLSATDNIAYGPKLRGVKGRALKVKLNDMLDLVGLGGMGDRLPAELSGGQRQRVAIARALATDPEIILLDEPLSNLDERLRGQVRAELNRILRDAGVTVVLVTHDQSEAFTMCDRVAVMLGGHLHQIGSPEELYHSASSYGVASFVGESNMLEAVVQSAPVEGQVQVEISLGGQRLSTGARPSEPVAAGVSGLVQLRPEWLRLSAPDAIGAQTPHAVGIVDERIFQGVFVEYTITLADRSLLARVFSDQPMFDAGEAVAITWSPEAPRFFPRDIAGAGALREPQPVSQA